MTEQELLALYEQRDQRAIQETEAAYGRYLSKVAGAVLSSREDVEECLNDTWLRAWNSIPPEKPKYFRAYLSRIVVLPTSESTEEAADKNRLAACIDRFLEKLPKTQRILFVRRYFYTDSIQEIALRQGMSESAVKVSLYRIRKNLALVLREEEFL